jgi:arylsulfatase A-like enzyme
MEVYAAMAESLDHEVGRLIAYLKATGEYDNTVFVFLSDNGPEGSDYKEADLWLRFNYSRDLERLGGKGAYVVPGPSLGQRISVAAEHLQVLCRRGRHPLALDHQRCGRRSP